MEDLNLNEIIVLFIKLRIVKIEDVLFNRLPVLFLTFQQLNDQIRTAAAIRNQRAQTKSLKTAGNFQYPHL